MTREELRDYVDEQRTLNNIPYHVYSALIDDIDTLEQEPTTKTDLAVDKLLADCKKMSFEIKLFNKPLRVVALDAVKNIVKDLSPVTPQEPSYNLVKSELKQEPKAKAFDILHFVADNAGLSTFEAIEKAYNMGVSEQEPILDKIRAEIKQLPTSTCSEIYRMSINADDFKENVLAIFDKYREESEKV